MNGNYYGKISRTFPLTFSITKNFIKSIIEIKLQGNLITLLATFPESVGSHERQILQHYECRNQVDEDRTDFL